MEEHDKKIEEIKERLRKRKEKADKELTPDIKVNELK